MKPNIFKSRKFLLAISDAAFSIAAMVVTFILSKEIEVRVLVLGVLATLQPVFIALINGIATEDAAYMAADAVGYAAFIAADAASGTFVADETRTSRPLPETN